MYTKPDFLNNILILTIFLDRSIKSLMKIRTSQMSEPPLTKVKPVSWFMPWSLVGGLVLANPDHLLTASSPNWPQCDMSH